MRLGVVTQQPNERKSYSIVYEDALDEGDDISAVLSCVSAPDDLNVTPAHVSPTRCRIWISGGESGATYKVTIIVATSGGEELEDELIVRVKEI